jgi:SAM-dependent methyltransferase
MPSTDTAEPSSTTTRRSGTSQRRRLHPRGRSPVTILRALWDLLGFPLRAFLLPEKWQRALGLTPLRDERYAQVARLATGPALDVACGDNDLVRRRLRPLGLSSIGMDQSLAGADIVGDAAELPFRSGTFRTVSIVAALNHVPKGRRRQALREAHRVLGADGRLVITMIGPLVGWLCHALTWWDPWPAHDPSQEDPGISFGEVVSLAKSAGFTLVRRERFLYGLNAVLLFHTASTGEVSGLGSGPLLDRETADR